jgi:hypothetical protein
MRQALVLPQITDTGVIRGGLSVIILQQDVLQKG